MSIAICLLLTFIYSLSTKADSFDYNIYNNHGTVGLINIPSARFYDEGVHGVTIYDSEVDQKLTLTSNPYDWLEASFFYVNIPKDRVCRYYYDLKYCEGYKDKGFNLKVRVKEEGNLPAVAIGLMDFAGTGKYSAEYIVSSYGIGNIDIHFGLGWGKLAGTNNQIKNPLGYIKDSFYERQGGYSGEGGQLNLSKYFSGKKASPFYGISYSINENTIFKFEKDTILVDDGSLPYPERNSNYSFGIDYSFNNNFTFSMAYEKGSYPSLKFVYKNNPKRSFKKYEYKESEKKLDDSLSPEANKYNALINNLENNGIGVTKITETSRSIGLNLTQFIHPDLKVVEDIVFQATRDAGINKSVKKNISIADFQAVSEIDEQFERNSKLIYEREDGRRFVTDTGFQIRPFIASREEFFKGALLIENTSEYVIRRNFFFNTNIKYNLANNFDDLVFPPEDIYPAQVRSDVKQYLKGMDGGILLGRAQLDYHFTPSKNHHLMLTGGVLEDMFSGIGGEYLYYKPDNNYSFGLELFKVKKRDYDWGFGHLDYENTMLTANFYYRNYGSIPFDMHISAGEYLAGDIGSTIQFSRTFEGGIKFGAFASFTDVSSEDFGEGSFDKGIFFSIPIYGNLIDYTWRPLTKDPAAKLVRKNNLHSLLVRLKPLN